MAAEPAFEPVDEAEAILDALPERWRAQFLEEYRQALDAAHEVWRFHQIRDVLRVWHLRCSGVLASRLRAGGAHSQGRPP